MSKEWKDITSFSRGDTERETRTVQLDAAGMKLVVTRHISHDPRDWVLNCAPWFNNRKVGDGSLEDAKETALWLVRDRLRDALAILNQGSNDETES